MRPTTPIAWPSPLAPLAVICAVVVTCTLISAGAVSRAGAAVIGPGAHQPTVPSVLAQPAEATDAQQAQALRYWTAARMAAARPLGPPRRLTASQARPAGATRQSRARAPSPGTGRRAAIRRETSTADWPGGGAVARTTGKVFFTMDRHDYVCSGASVTSANADVVVTAAHCVKNGTGSWASNWAFVPGYADGTRPYGTWTARQFFVASQWSQAADDNDDVAFVTLNPQASGGQSALIGHVVGGQAIAFGSQPSQEYAFGYPAEPPYGGGALYYCSGRTRPDGYRASEDTGLHCDLTAGSSGGPWLSAFNPATGTGTITSVSSFKYSTDQATLWGPPLGPTAQALFDQAQQN
jgi:V8-like Glu-specific endopeptidase